MYRARDTKLDRGVALKVLPEAFTSHPDRPARFEREAKVLTSLRHADIVCRHRPDKVGAPSIFGMATMNRWNLQVEAGRVEEASELLDEIWKITGSELPEESAEE